MVASTCAAAAAGDRVMVGMEGEAPDWFTLAPPDCETDPARGLISVESALGRALVGRQPGERVTVRAPGNPYQVTILEVGR